MSWDQSAVALTMARALGGGLGGGLLTLPVSLALKSLRAPRWVVVVVGSCLVELGPEASLLGRLARSACVGAFAFICAGVLELQQPPSGEARRNSLLWLLVLPVVWSVLGVLGAFTANSVVRGACPGWSTACAIGMSIAAGCLVAFGPKERPVVAGSAIAAMTCSVVATWATWPLGGVPN